jgi:hypothetical protein
MEQFPQIARFRGSGWMDLDSIASVEVSSEEKDYPIESALMLGKRGPWRAANSGMQLIRLVFDAPLKIKRIFLAFEDAHNARTQEFVLRWSSDTNSPFREIVRQQRNFSVPSSVRETEQYSVELSDVKVLELMIVPDKSGGEVRATLMSLRVA